MARMGALDTRRGVRYCLNLEIRTWLISIAARSRGSARQVVYGFLAVGRVNIWLSRSRHCVPYAVSREPEMGDTVSTVLLGRGLGRGLEGGESKDWTTRPLA
jgi:hypothetical protein